MDKKKFMKIEKEKCCFRKKNRRILKKTVGFKNVVDDLKKKTEELIDSSVFRKNYLLERKIVFKAKSKSLPWRKDDAIIYCKKLWRIQVT